MKLRILFVVSVFAALVLLGSSACAPSATPTPLPAPATPVRILAPTAVAVPATVAAPAVVGKIDLRFNTGPKGGSWYPLAAAIAEFLQKDIPGITITVMDGGGIQNVEAVDGGQAELGFGNACSTVDGQEGRDPFKAKTKNVRELATLYYQYFQLVVADDSGVKSVADLKGRSVAPQPKGTTAEQMFRDVMELNKLAYTDMGTVQFVSYNDGVNLVRSRAADSFPLISTIPAPAVAELDKVRKIRILAFSDADLAAMNKKNAGYAKRLIPKGTYPGIDYDVASFGTYAHFMVNAALPDDLVYKITVSVASHIPDMAAVVKDMKSLTLEEMAFDVGIPYHPGALKYYKEKGAIK